MNEVKRLQHSTALEIFRYVVPFLKTRVTNETVYGIKASLQTLLYVTVCGAIFNKFLMDRRTIVSRTNIEGHESDMKELLSFYDTWSEEVEVSKHDPNQFISRIT